MINPREEPCDVGAIVAVRCTMDVAAARKPWVLAATILGSSMAFINGSVINIALPAIRSDLDAPVELIQWVINAYTLWLAALILIGGAAGDRFGRRRLFLVGLIIFAAAAIWCSLVPDVTHLIAARALQGIGAAMLIPNSLAIIGATFDESERGRAIGTWAGVAALGAAAGPLFGGWLVDYASWRAIFAISPVMALPTLWIALRYVPDSRDGSATGLDVRGAVLAFLGLGGVVFGLIALPKAGWTSPMVLAPFGFGVLLLLAFLREERHSTAPMMPLELFASRQFSGVNLLTVLLYAALAGAFFLIPFDLIYVHGYSATVTGAVFLPFALLIGLLSRWLGGVQDRIGARWLLIVGPTVAAAGYALLALSPFGPSVWAAFVLPMSVVGLGMAISVAPLTTVVLGCVPKERAGVASGINNTVAQTANLMAVAIFGAVALASFNGALESTAKSVDASPAVRSAILDARGNFALAPVKKLSSPQERKVAEDAIRRSLGAGIDMAFLLAALSALVGALCAVLTIGTPRQPAVKSAGRTSPAPQGAAE